MCKNFLVRWKLKFTWRMNLVILISSFCVLIYELLSMILFFFNLAIIQTRNSKWKPALHLNCVTVSDFWKTALPTWHHIWIVQILELTLSLQAQVVRYLICYQAPIFVGGILVLIAAHLVSMVNRVHVGERHLRSMTSPSSGLVWDHMRWSLRMILARVVWVQIRLNIVLILALFSWKRLKTLRNRLSIFLWCFKSSVVEWKTGTFHLIWRRFFSLFTNRLLLIVRVKIDNFLLFWHIVHLLVLIFDKFLLIFKICQLVETLSVRHLLRSLLRV